MSGSGIGPDGQWVPEFEGQRPPAGPGNTLALKHGAWSVASQDEAQRLVLEEASALNPDWLVAIDRYEAEAWAYAEGRCRLLRRALEGKPPVREDGKPQGASVELRAWTRLAAQHRAALGFNPLARARLDRDVAQAAVGMAHLEADGARLIEKFAPKTIDGEAS